MSGLCLSPSEPNQSWLLSTYLGVLSSPEENLFAVLNPLPSQAYAPCAHLLWPTATESCKIMISITSRMSASARRAGPKMRPDNIPPIPAACFRAAWTIQPLDSWLLCVFFYIFDSIIGRWKQGSPERHVPLLPQSTDARWRVSSP